MENNLSALQFNRTMAPAIDSICEPLFKTFGLIHFGYIRILPNNKMFRVANNPSWSDKYFSCGFYNAREIYSIDKMLINNVSYTLLVGAPQNEFCKAICYEFNMWNFLLIQERFKDYRTMWFFGANKENTEILDLYLNHTKELKKFIIYFKEKFLSNFNFSDPNMLITTDIDHSNATYTKEEPFEKFLSDTKIPKYSIKNTDGNIPLSKREGECLFHYSKGLGAKKIASLMHLSPRTVESYIKNIKMKAHCQNKKQIIQIATNNFIFSK